ncbi:MAG TPA: DUF2723 domain-containing protein [Rubricoccaceae bacterium]|nr:DUF2723 domain-containing protein [Rubricoccaceae bacterium]
MTPRLIDRLVAAGVFVVSLVVYLLTMAETAPFWDSGEFIAISALLEVSHPPGAPFYMLVGRFFAMLAPLFGAFSPEPVAFAVNLVSALASAATVLLTHLIIVKLVRIWKGHPDTWTVADRVAALGGGALGALAFAFSDSFWFNAVEAEVYALSMFFTAVVVWLILLWREETVAEEAAFRARGEHPFGLKADRYLVAIAYVFGLAIGVHLLNVLTLFFLALIVFFEKAERPEWTTGRRALGIVMAGGVAALCFFVIYPGIVQMLPSLAGSVGSPLLVFLLVTAILGAAVWWTQKNKKPVANLVALSVVVILLGYSTYALIFIRSAADPPIDENDPETTDAIVSYLKREQYGSVPLLRGPTYDDATGRVGRARMDPRTGQPVVDASGYYVLEESLFPRRHSTDPSHVAVYRQYTSDMDFFWRYQLGYMYVRYFLWNFVGRAGDHQGGAWATGLFEDAPPADALTPSERAGYNFYFGLPLLLGLAGMAFHFVRDWRRAFAVLVLFFVTGVGIILYLNQTPLQPRERDYSYVASFFAFALWIGIGATGLMEMASGALAARGEGLRRALVPVVGAALLLVVPGWMLAVNYDDHDRSGRRLATDFAVNMLESTAPNAIVFTNGDNDTFPLWYAQEVLGVRRDVRVVNLSLLNTPWYIRQLKNQWSRESAPLPMTLTDEEVAYLDYVVGFEPQDVSLPVPRGRLSEVVGDTAGVPATMTWRLEGRAFGGDQRLLQVSDRAVLDILIANAQQGWQRPIYFASTVGRDSELGLQPFFQDEGLARRVVPVRTENAGPDGRVVPEIALDRLSKFRFRNLADPSVYYDENERNLADSYRPALADFALGLATQGRPAEARAVMDRLMREVPFETIPPDAFSLYAMSGAYEAMGDSAAVRATLRRMEAFVLRDLGPGASPDAQRRATQFAQIVQGAYLRNGAYEEASAFLDRLALLSGDPRLRTSPESLRRETEAMRRAASGAGPPAPPDGTRPDSNQAPGLQP